MGIPKCSPSFLPLFIPCLLVCSEKLSIMQFSSLRESFTSLIPSFPLICPHLCLLMNFPIQRKESPAFIQYCECSRLISVPTKTIKNFFHLTRSPPVRMYICSLNAGEQVSLYSGISKKLTLIIAVMVIAIRSVKGRQLSCSRS